MMEQGFLIPQMLNGKVREAEPENRVRLFERQYATCGVGGRLCTADPVERELRVLTISVDRIRVARLAS
jgi:hypothetical protein